MEAFAALADDTRRAIVERLAQGEATAGELAAGFATSRPGISRHLRVLREAGLVESQARATQRVYRLCREPFDDVRTWLDDVTSFWAQRLDALDTEIARGARARKEPS